MGYISGETAGRNGLARAPVPLPIDDSRLFCEALLAALRAALNVDTVETAATLAEALERLRRRPAPDLMLLDLNLADTDGLGRLVRLTKAAPGLAVIVVPTPCDDRVVASVVRVGPGLIAEYGPHSLVEAIGRVSASDRPPAGASLPRASGRAALEPDAADQMRSLTPQQARILQLVCEGKFNKQIAYDLDISEGTVKAHLTAILRKLNVRNRTQAVLLAQSVGFAPTSAGGPGLS